MAAATKKATEGFATLSTQITYNPKSSEGKGFLPPLLRSLVHLAYSLGIAEDGLPKTVTTTSEKKEKEVLAQIKEEIVASIGHMDQVEISNNFSSVAQTQLSVFHKALNALNAEFESWDRDAKINNLTSLIHKAFGITAMLDRELIGLRNSDPGSNL